MQSVEPHNHCKSLPTELFYSIAFCQVYLPKVLCVTEISLRVDDWHYFNFHVTIAT